MAAMEAHWDIFCRVIDNYGDIGVCWRLARQLSSEHGISVRLWVDDLLSLETLCQETVADGQLLEGVEIRRWPASFPPAQAAEVVIEAFACDLPASYLEAMARRPSPPCWINLEYLSAEAWVEDCHRLASRHPSLPLTKHFFFPGFTPGTGGLLREKDLFRERGRFLSTLAPSDCLEVSLFCYEGAPVGELLDIWASGGRPVRCHVPPGKPLAAVAGHLGGQGPWQRGNLDVVPIPFVPQDQFDRLLWRCAVNFIRGEDSFVRAQWAARPFVWHIYPQEEAAHLAKLDAFLERYTGNLAGEAAEAARNMFHAWNTGEGLGAAWEAFAGRLPLLEQHGHEWAKALAGHADLAAGLVKFCRNTL